MSVILELEKKINNIFFEIELELFDNCLIVEGIVEFLLEWLKVVDEWGIIWDFY